MGFATFSTHSLLNDLRSNQEGFFFCYPQSEILSLNWPSSLSTLSYPLYKQCGLYWPLLFGYFLSPTPMHCVFRRLYIGFIKLLPCWSKIWPFLLIGIDCRQLPSQFFGSPKLLFTVPLLLAFKNAVLFGINLCNIWPIFKHCVYWHNKIWLLF